MLPSESVLTSHQSSNSTNSRVRPRKNNFDARDETWRDWMRHSMNGKAPMTDVDCVRYRWHPSGYPEPVAIIEWRRYDWADNNHVRFLEQHVEVGFKTHGQDKVAVMLAEKLGVGAWLCSWGEGLDRFWLLNLIRRGVGWVEMNQTQMKNFIINP